MASSTILLFVSLLAIACSTEDLFPCKFKKAVISFFYSKDTKVDTIFEKGTIEGQCPKNDCGSRSYFDVSFPVDGSEPSKIADLKKGHFVKLSKETCPDFCVLTEDGNSYMVQKKDFTCNLFPFSDKDTSDVTSLPSIKSVSCYGCTPFQNDSCEAVIDANFQKNRSSVTLISDYGNPNQEDEDFYVGFDVGLPFREGSQNMRSHLERFLANPWAEVEQAYTFEHRAEKTLNESRQLFDIWDKCITVLVCDRPAYCQKLIMTTGKDCWNDNDADCYKRFVDIFNTTVYGAYKNVSLIRKEETYIQVEMNQSDTTMGLWDAFVQLNSMLALPLVSPLPDDYPKNHSQSGMCSYKKDLTTIFKTHDDLLEAYSLIPKISMELQKIAMKFDYETRTLDRYVNWIAGVLAANLFAYGSMEKCGYIPVAKMNETRRKVVDASFKALKSVYDMEHALVGQHWKYLRTKGIKIIDTGWNKNEIVVKNVIQELALDYTRVDFMAIVHNNLVPYNEPKKIASYPDTAYDSWALKHSDYPDINYDRFRTVFSNGERGGKSFEIDHRWTSEYYAPIQPNNEKKEAYAELKKRLSALSGDVISVRDQIVKEFKAFLPEEWHVLSVIVMEGAYEPKAMCHKQPDSPHQFVYGVTHEKWFYAVAFWSRVQYEVCNKLPEP